MRPCKEQGFVSERCKAEPSLAQIRGESVFVQTVQVSVDRCGLVAVDAEDVANALPIRCGDEHTSTRPDNTPHFVEHSLRFWEMFDYFGRNSTVERSVGKRKSLAVCDDCDVSLIGRFSQRTTWVRNAKVHRTDCHTAPDERSRKPAVTTSDVEHKSSL